MKRAPQNRPSRGNVAAAVRGRIDLGGERLWRFEDFRDLPFPAVAQALSRLARAGVVERLSKGTYYRSRETAFGNSRPNPADVRRLAARHRRLFPSGLAAANHLGFTTQTPSRPELATSAASLPRKLVGSQTVVHTRRPAAWATLSETDAAILDFLRNPDDHGEMTPEDTLRRMLGLLIADKRYERLAAVADTEPPRVRALLGALGEQLGKRASVLNRLRQSLNPLSRFRFGVLSRLPNARAWQAKERRT